MSAASSWLVLTAAVGPWTNTVPTAGSKVASRLCSPHAAGGSSTDGATWTSTANLPQACGIQLRIRGRRQTVRDMVEAVVARCGGPPADYGALPARSNEPEH